MDYYPQSMGPVSAPFVPYLDQLALGSEKVIYQPHVQTIVPSGGSIYTKRNPIHPPTITVQCESGMFACNYHELRKDVLVDDANELVVPPWLERTPTPDELAVEEKFRAQEEIWETKYWAGMEKKMKEAARAQERVENAGRRPTVTASVLKPGVSTATNSPSHIQKADSFRRILKKDGGSAKSGGGASSKNGGGGGVEPCGSECSTAGPYERRQSIASSVATKSAGGRGVVSARLNGSVKSRVADDVRSITSSNAAGPRLRVVNDHTETESICSMISSVYSEDDLARRSANNRAHSSVGHNSATSRGAATAAKSAAGAKGTTVTATTSRTSKMSPRQRMLQQQQEQQTSQISHHRLSSSVSSASGMGFSPSVAGSPHAGAAGGVASPNNAPMPTNGTSSLTTPYSSKCFTVAEGTEPFAWGTPRPIVTKWLRELLDGGSPRSAVSSPSNMGGGGGGNPLKEGSGHRAGSHPATAHSDGDGSPVALRANTMANVGSRDPSASPPNKGTSNVTAAPSAAASPIKGGAVGTMAADGTGTHAPQEGGAAAAAGVAPATGAAAAAANGGGSVTPPAQTVAEGAKTSSAAPSATVSKAMLAGAAPVDATAGAAANKAGPTAATTVPAAANNNTTLNTNQNVAPSSAQPKQTTAADTKGPVHPTAAAAPAPQAKASGGCCVIM